MSLAEQLRRAIRSELDYRGMTQVAFARLVGVSEKHVSCVLLGKAGASLDTLDEWASALGCRWRVHLIPSQ